MHSLLGSLASRLGSTLWRRLWRHVWVTDRDLRRTFPSSMLESITAAIAHGETQHGGELRLVIEADLDLAAVWRGQTPRQRAIALFAEWHVWDTAANNGILLYVQLADRAVEVVADRGFAGRVSPAEWELVCAGMRTAFAAGRFEAGALAGIQQASALLARHFPPGVVHNELPDRPLIL